MPWYKRLIKRVVYNRETACWRATVCLFYNMYLYECSVSHIRLHTWWIFLKHYPSLFRHVSSVIAITSGTQPKLLGCNFRNKLCKLCTDRCVDDFKHILFECKALEIMRHAHLSYIKFIMPRAMRDKFFNMNNDNKAIFILSGFKCEY